MGDHSIKHGRRTRDEADVRNATRRDTSIDDHDDSGDAYRVNFSDAYVDDFDDDGFGDGEYLGVSGEEDYDVQQVYTQPYYADEDTDEDYVLDGEEYGQDTAGDFSRRSPASPAARFTRKSGGSSSSGTQGAGRTGYFEHRGAKQKHENRWQTLGNRKYIYIAAVVVVLGILIFGAIKLVGGIGTSKQTVEAGTAVTVNIPDGSSTSAIADILVDQGVISDASSFKSYVKSQNEESSLKPGTYSMTTGMDEESVLALLVKGPNGISVTIPEGYTVQQTADAVSEATGISSEEFVALCNNAGEYASEYPFLTGAYNNSLEGYLFPKTYSIQAGSTADEVIRMMLDQYATETANLDMSYPESKGLSSNDVVVMASLIEKEAFFDEDRSHIAGVLYNRLDDGMRLQLDVTVSYALGGKSTDLTYDDLDVDSPYNTYKIDGLPPGPICSPGLASLQAVCSPLQTNDLYFILTDQYSWFYDNDADFQAGKEAYKAQ